MSNIEERLRGENWWLNVSGDEAADEIRTLHAHLRHRSDVNTELRAEIARLRADAVSKLHHYDDVQLYDRSLIKALTTDNERLTAALRAIETMTLTTNEVRTYARAALEGK